jgi:hypothetical protein
MSEATDPKEKTSRIKIESFTKEQPGVSNRKNEDSVFIKEDETRIVAFLIDGATSLSEITTSNKIDLNGYWIAQTATESVNNSNTSKTAYDLLTDANTFIALKEQEKGIDANNTPSESLPTSSGASIVVIDKIKQTVDLAQVGDTITIVVKNNGEKELVFPIKNCVEDIEAYNLAKELSELHNISIQEALKEESVAEILLMGRSRENNPPGNGYGAINGKESIDKYIMQRNFSLNDIKQIIILSDGMLLDQNETEEMNKIENIVDLINKLGIQAYYDLIYKEKEGDTKLIKHPRLKIHDDASAIVISF